MLRMVSYYCAIVTLSVRRTSTSKNIASVKVSENVTIRYKAYDFLLMFYCNYGSISRVSEIFNVEKYRDSETLKTELRVRQGHRKYHHSIERI